MAERCAGSQTRNHVCIFSAKKFQLWVPSERVYELPDASFLCEYFKSVGRLLEDGHFEEANLEALSWKPILDKAKMI